MINLGTSKVLKIGGILSFSTLDYPGKLSAVVFCQGCPNRCVYCHNPDFLDPFAESNETFENLLTFLQQRKGLLDAVVFSGGEPLMQPTALISAIETIKKMDFSIGLHTSGVTSIQTSEIFRLLDWVGFDIKTTFDKYEMITRVPNSGLLARRSLQALLDSEIKFEIRTTYDPRLISDDGLLKISKFLNANGIEKWVIQECILRENGARHNLALPNPRVLDELKRYVEIEIRRE